MCCSKMFLNRGFVSSVMVIRKISGFYPFFGRTYNYPPPLWVSLIVVYLVNCISDIYMKFGSEAWLLKKREEQRLEAAQMKFLRHLLRITELDKEKTQCIREITGAENIVKEIKQCQ